MHYFVSSSASFSSSAPGSKLGLRRFQSLIQFRKIFRPGNLFTLLGALCMATVTAQGQSTPSRAIVGFSADSTNCEFADPNGGTIWNSGTISITINNSETESAIYQCQTAGAPYDYIQNLANNINANSPWVTAVVLADGYFSGGGSLWLTSKATGTAANYPLSFSATYYSNDFTGPAYFASGPPTMTGGATSRNFRMGAWFDNVPAADEDLSFMYASGNPSLAGNDMQLSGLYIMDLGPYAGQYTLPQKDSHGNPYDYNRIVAIVVDEPYTSTAPPWTNPCHDSRYQSEIQPTSQALQALAQQIRQQTPRTRLWINYSEPEVQWMMDTTCGANSMAILNGSFIDVVSMDKYRVPFAGGTSCLVPQEPGACVQPYYDWLIANRAYAGQQVALIPGIESLNSPSNDVQIQASLLQGFFDYATQKQTCNLPLGNTGATGHADGCLVWIVIGFTPHDSLPYIGENDPGGQPMQQVWRTEVSLPSTVPLTRPSSLATIMASSGTPFSYFFVSGGQVYTLWCTSATACAWDDPSGDAGRGPDGTPPAAAYGSPLNAVATANGFITYFLTSNGHLVWLNTSLGFSDTWQDVTAAGGNFAAVTGGSLATVLGGQTPFSYFFIGGGQIIDNWCTSATACAWDAPSADAGRGPDGAAPAAAPTSPLNVISTANGLIAYYLTANGHLISLNTSLGFSDTWQDITAAGGNFAAVTGSPLATILSGQTAFSYFFIGGGQIIDNWCTSATTCAWDDPSGDAGRGPDGTPPAAAPTSPLNVVATPNGLIAYYLTANGHLIALNTSLGFSDTWQDITAAGGAPVAATESPLTTVVSSNGTVIAHFVTSGAHLISISCTTAGQCTSTDETQSAQSAPVAFF